MATSSSSGAIQYLSAVRQPSLLSFESETDSILATRTASSDVTATTSSTIWGPGAITGKGVLSVGKAILRGTTAVVIQVRLQVLKSLFPHDGGYNDEGTLHKAYRDMLELTRKGCYSSRVRKQALRLAILQIYSGHISLLLTFLSEWPHIEICLFLRELMLCLPSELTSLRAYQQDMHSQLVRDLIAGSRSKMLRSMEFFARVITEIDVGAEAFVDAEGLDLLLCVHALKPDVFSDLTEGGFWDGVDRILLRDASAAQQRLVAVIRDVRVTTSWPPNDDTLRPPTDESIEQRLRRQEAQLDAEKVSRKIDQDLQEEKKALEKRKRAIKVLLLGQSESDTSTILKNFQRRSSREVLQQNIRLEDSRGLFLDNAAPVSFKLTDELLKGDIGRARVRTAGVEEHLFNMRRSIHGSNHPMYVYNVGGPRSLRPQWIPYFDDVQAIIFIASLAFNQMLEEDSKVSRLEESVHLWQEICSNRLLAKANIILFFNDMDVLRANLASGIKVVDYITSYGDRPNDYENVTRYFRYRFKSVHTQLSPIPRPFIWHETDAIDTRAALTMLSAVKDGIFRTYLQIFR